MLHDQPSVQPNNPDLSPGQGYCLVRDTIKTVPLSPARQSKWVPVLVNVGVGSRGG